MANTALNVVITDGNTNETRNQTLTDLNPAATNAQLKAFAQTFYGLSDDTYVDAVRIDKKDVDTEDTAVSASKLFREITVTDAAKNGTAKITFNRTETEGNYGGVSLIVFYYNTEESTAEKLTVSSVSSGNLTVALYHVTIPNYNGRLYAGIEATEDFYSEFVKLTISS